MSGTPCAIGQFGIKLGFHGDDSAQLELEVVDRAEHSGFWTMGRTAPARAHRRVANGVQAIHRAVRTSTGSNHSRWPTNDRQAAGLERITACLQSMAACRLGMTAEHEAEVRMSRYRLNAKPLAEHPEKP